MKRYLALLILVGCATPDYRYEVHLVDGGGTHHLITADTKDEAWEFVDEQEDSHGAMKIIKLKR
jgi:hypothetical protein